MTDPARRPDTLPLSPRRAVLASVLVAIVVGYFAWGLRDVPFDSDEANHANLALRQFQDLHDGLFTDFLRHSWRTGQFPFLHGWTVIPFFAALGTTPFAARIAQLPWLVIGTAATAFAAARLSGSKRAGGFAGALFALSPLVAGYAGLSMVETTGAALTAVALAVFVEASRADEMRRALKLDALTALAVVAVYFVKYNYGLVAIGSAGLGYLMLAVPKSSRRRGFAGLAVYCGLLAAIGVAWYWSPTQREAFKGFLTNPGDGPVSDHPGIPGSGLSGAQLTGYPVAIATDAHLHWTLGASVFALFAWGLWRAARTRDVAVFAVASTIVATWLGLSTGIRDLDVRYIAAALPSLWIVAAVGAAPMLARIREGGVSAFVVRTVLLAAFCAQVWRLNSVMPDLYESTGRDYAPFFAAVAKEIPPKCAVLVVNYTDRTSARTIDWTLSTMPGRVWRDHDVKGLIAEKVYESDRELDEWMTLPRQYGDGAWESVVVEVIPGTSFTGARPETIDRWTKGLARYATRLELVRRVRFPELDVTVMVWRDRSPPPFVGLGGPR